MQSHTQVLTFEGYTAAQFFLLVQQAMKQLHWQVQVVSEDVIKGTVAASGWSWGEVISVQVYEKEAWVTSQYRQWTLPLDNKNRQNLKSFHKTVAELQTRYHPIELTDKVNESLLASIGTAVETETYPASNVGYNYAMYGLGITMIILFGVMVCLGVSLYEPDAHTLRSWGGNYAPEIYAGQYWRLLTALFIHAGILHLAFNLYALYIIGLHLEPVIGSWRFLLAFLLTGLVASTTSIWWHSDIISVGASGAIFGLYGIFLALLLTGAVSKQVKANLLGSMVLFVAVNLLHGLKEGIDNAAHIGGLVSGLIFGLLLTGEWKWKRLRLLFRAVGLALPLLITIPHLLWSQQAREVSSPAKVVPLVGHLQQMLSLDQLAIEPIASASNKSANQLAGEVERVCIPSWTAMAGILAQYDQVPLDSFNRRLHTLFTAYTKLRLKESALYIQKVDDSLHFSPEALTNVQAQVRTIQDTIVAIKW